ncbi:hypothetical protein CA833_21330 [Novosphingobium sp. KA1]|nr:hypothetical protein CA833_21330 [Novosphingobium sp. KA1]
MFVASLQDALRLVLEYGLSVPRAFVTLHDEVILDVKDGVLDFPADAKSLFDEAKACFPSWNTKWLEAGNLGRWTRSRSAKLTYAARAYAEASGFDGSTPEAYEHPVNRIEHELQSVAAQFGLNLYQFGYQAPGVVCAELERFDDRQPTPGQYKSRDEGNSETAPSEMAAFKGGQAEFRFGSQGASEGEDHRSNQADGGRAERLPSKPPIARIWWGVLLVVLLAIGSPWSPGEFDKSISRIVMIPIYGSMAAAAALLYWALSSIYPEGARSASDSDDLWSSDEFGLQNWRDGKVPRYMDETDPASGPLWEGNLLHEQVTKDQAERTLH